MKKLIWILAFYFGTTAIANADILGNHRSQAQVAFQQNAQASGVGAIEPATILQTAAAIIDYLGARAGSAYIFTTRERGIATLVGATIYTFPYNIALDIDGVDTKNGNGGVGVSVDYNLGQWLPTKGVPVVQYTQYLYVGAGGGVIFVDSHTYGFGMLDAQFKVTF